MSRHTEGKWGIEKRGGHSSHGVRPVIVPKDGHIDRIAIVSYRGGAEYPSECDANAQLIAAAPDLLAACERAARSCHHPACLNVGQHCTCHVGTAQAAIAKATEEVNG